MPSKAYLSKLLPVNQLYGLYVCLGDELRTGIDIQNAGYDRTSLTNSLSLLGELSFVTLRFGRYSKKGTRYDLDLFKDELSRRTHQAYASELSDIFSAEPSYDEEAGVFKIKRNMVPLRLSGLLLVLDGLGQVKVQSKEVLILNPTIIHERTQDKSRVRRIMTLTQLKNKLILQDSLGHEAEMAALQFEKNQLSLQGIAREPLLVSNIDVSAGYDIVSFSNNQSDHPNKFIEVKSCSDDTFKFFISKNEIQTARSKGLDYFLYLYNRKTKTFRVVQDPYVNILTNEKWATDAQVYAVHHIG